MSKVLNNFNLESNFWKVNPQLTIPFKELMKRDKQKDFNRSSKILWAIALLVDPASKFINTSEGRRKELIEQDFIKSETKFNWTKYKPEIELYRELALSKAERFLINWEQKLEERDGFIASLKYDENTYELLDKMLKETKKMWDQYQSCLKDVEDEGLKSQVQGGAELSVSDKGIL